MTKAHMRIKRYALAVTVTGVAAGANGVLWPDFGLRYPLIGFYPAITVSAWFGGFWPGVVCTTLSCFIAAFVWFDPRSSLRISDQADAIALLAFFSVGVVISALSESLTRQTRRERAARFRAEEAEARLATELAEMQRLQELNTSLLNQDELPRILHDVLNASMKVLSADSGAVQLYDEVEDTLTIIAQVGLSQEFVDDFATIRTVDSVCAAALARRERVIIEDVSHTTVFPDLAAMFDADVSVTVQSTPFLGRSGKPLGVLSTFFRQHRCLADRELRFLDLYVHQAGLAIERSRLLDAERIARREAEEANRLKDHFLSTVSHELRTPLNAILGWADMLRSGLLAEARRDRALQAIYDNAQRQVQLIGDLLDVSRIMSGKLRFERTTIDVQSVIQSALSVIEPAAHAKAIDLVVNQHPTVITSFGDASRLQQVVWNLLSNAVKFTPNGGAVHVDVRDDGNVVEIIVRDTGIGIPRAFLPFVFDPFRQADGSTTRSYDGLGLGLSIARQIVEAHGGSVHADSEGDGKGAQFTLRLPVGSAPTGPSVGRSSIGTGETLVSATSLLRGISVLVVDDDADSREVISASLEEAGAIVILATSAAEALERLQTRQVNLLVADIAMPGEDGYSLIHKIRASTSSEIASVPAVALTSMARDEDRMRAVDAGFHLHLSKPVDARSMAYALATLVREVETGPEEPKASRINEPAVSIPPTA